MRKPHEDWTDVKIEKLQTLWATDMSTDAIGRKMNISKSAVVNKAHRLNLNPRQSPIRRRDTNDIPPRVVAPRRVKGPTLPPLPTSDAPPLHMVAAPAPLPPPPPPAQLERPDAESRFACRWPNGDPGSHDFAFCGEHIGTNRTYCAKHHAIAFIAPSTLVREHAPLATIEAYAAEHHVAVMPATGISGLVVAVNHHRRAVGLTPFSLRQSMAA